MDILYPLSNQSEWKDNELRYSLRSLEQIEYDRVFVIGHKPDWLTPNDRLFHVEHKDTPNRPEFSTMTKICHICKETDISDDFILMNDDFYFLRPVHDYPYYFDGTLLQAARKRAKASSYRVSIDNTIEVFGDAPFFEVHGPIVLNKEMFPLCMKQVDWTHKDYLKRSLYCNFLDIEGVEMKDVKVEFTKLDFTDEPFFSSGTRSNYNALGRFLDSMYCEKSVFEV